MRGEDISDKEYDIYCSDVQTFEQLERPKGYNTSYTGYQMDLTAKVNPCGIAAKFIFNGIIIH